MISDIPNVKTTWAWIGLLHFQFLLLPHCLSFVCANSLCQYHPQSLRFVRAYSVGNPLFTTRLASTDSSSACHPLQPIISSSPTMSYRSYLSLASDVRLQLSAPQVFRPNLPTFLSFFRWFLSTNLLVLSCHRVTGLLLFAFRLLPLIFVDTWVLVFQAIQSFHLPRHVLVQFCFEDRLGLFSYHWFRACTCDWSCSLTAKYHTHHILWICPCRFSTNGVCFDCKCHKPLYRISCNCVVEKKFQTLQHTTSSCQP